VILPLIGQLLNFVPGHVTQLEIKHGEKEDSDEVQLKLGESHAQAGVTPSAPAEEGVRLLLVFGAVGQEA